MVRNGKHKEVDSANLVQGDLIFLASGDMVTADLRLLEVHHLSIMESELMGESFEVEKQTNVLSPETVSALHFNEFNFDH